MKNFLIILFVGVMAVSVHAQTTARKLLHLNQIQGYASPTHPTNIAGCQMLLQAGLGYTTNDGSQMHIWTDMTGNGYNAPQYLSANLPIYKDAIINGLPALFFNGTNAVMSNSYAITSGMSTVVFIAKKLDTEADTPYVFLATPPLSLFLNPIYGRMTATDTWGTYVNAEFSSTFSINNWTLCASFCDGRTVSPVTNKLYTMPDGYAIKDDGFTRPALGANNTMSIGGYAGDYPTIASAFNGYIYMIGVWNRELTLAEIQSIYAYYKPRLGL